jgi:hypothetical protein
MSVPSDLREIERSLHQAIYGMTRLSASRTDARETLRRILVIWDAMSDGRPFDRDDWFALMERARLLVEDRP